MARFSGRDTRAQFWPYAAAAFALYFVVGWAVLGSILLPVLSAAQPSPLQFQNMMGRFLTANWVLLAALVALLAAAVARRLQDSGRSALWGLLPLPFAIYSATMMPRIFSQVMTGAPPDMRLFFSVFASNVLYFVGGVTLVVLLALRSTEGPTR